MSTTFKTVDYQATLDASLRLCDCVPPVHLARFVVDTSSQLDLSAIYALHGLRGGEPYTPETLLGLLFCGYATGVFSSPKIERATCESAFFRFFAGNVHPDHDTLANFRKGFLVELKGLFVEILLMARLAGVLQAGRISFDGTKVHAHGSKSNAVNYQRVVGIEKKLRAEGEELFALGERAEQAELPDGLVVDDESALRTERLARLAEAKAVLEAQAKERYALEQAQYELKDPETRTSTLHRPRLPHHEEQQQPGL